MAEPARQRFTMAEYLRLEELSPVKHEFLDGHVWAMAGGTPQHAAIAANVTSLLVAQLRGRRCRVFSSDLRIRVPATGLATYPDVTVVCNALAHDAADPNGHTVINPSLIVEVLSPSTEAYDRGEKLEHYRQLHALDEVVLVAQDARRIEVHRRGADGAWHRAEYTQGVAMLDALACTLPLDDVYRDPFAPT